MAQSGLVIVFAGKRLVSAMIVVSCYVLTRDVISALILHYIMYIMQNIMTCEPDLMTCLQSYNVGIYDIKSMIQDVKNNSKDIIKFTEYIM